jgi:hypothetical protein
MNKNLKAATDDLTTELAFSLIFHSINSTPKLIMLHSAQRNFVKHA